jgi:putative ABC transport system permease protein
VIRAALRNVVTHKVRLALTVLTVSLGIAFIAGTSIFTDSLRASFDALVAQPRPDVLITPRTALDDPNESGTAVSSSSLTLPESLLPDIEAIPGVLDAAGRVVTEGAYVLDDNGKPIGPNGPPARVATWLVDPQVTPIELASGAFPVGADEVALLDATALTGGYVIGDQVPIATPNDGVIRPTLVGLVKRPISGGLGGTLIVQDLPTAQQFFGSPGQVNQISLMLTDDADQTSVLQELTEVLPELTTVRTSDELADETADRIEEGFTFLNTFLLAFGFLALFVAAFLIFNTFAMLVAQRTRELALLRAIGATRRQVFGSVILEALAIGIISAAIGIFGGVGLAVLLRTLVDRFTGSLPAGPLVVSAETIILATSVGIGVTLIASLAPARRAAFVPPIAAMRHDTQIPEKSLRFLTVVGLVLVIGAIPLGIVALRTTDATDTAATWLGLSGLACLLGVLALTPVLARPLIGAVGAPLRNSTVGNLAVENARRNPRRTAATMSALAVGLALMASVTVIGSSARVSVEDVVDRTIGADFVVLGAGFRPLDPNIYQQLVDTPGTRVVTYIRNVPADVGGERTVITGVEQSVVSDVVDVQMVAGDVSSLALGNILIDSDLAESLDVTVGERISLDLINGTTDVQVVGIFEPIGFLQGLITAMPSLMSFGALEQDTAVYIRAADEQDLTELRESLQVRLSEFPAAQLQDQADIKREINQQFDVLFGFVYALLALSILVAFLGIVNTLSLSVAERFREIGLLRAVGSTRLQIRSMITVEALIIAFIGTIIGLTVGLIYGILFQRVLASEGVGLLAIPVPLLSLFVLFGVLGGLLASLWPAWRASKMSILRAVVTGD